MFLYASLFLIVYFFPFCLTGCHIVFICLSQRGSKRFENCERSRMSFSRGRRFSPPYHRRLFTQVCRERDIALDPVCFLRLPIILNRGVLFTGWVLPRSSAPLNSSVSLRHKSTTSLKPGHLEGSLAPEFLLPSCVSPISFLTCPNNS